MIIRFGLELLVPHRRRQLEEAFVRALDEDLEQCILPFDESAASAAAAIRRRARRPVELRDALIAGIVSARTVTLATGNRKHFDGFDIRMVDPWSR